MNNLQVIENNDQRVLTTAQIAEEYGTTSKVITDNFGNNKKHYTEGKHYYCLTGNVLKEFIQSLPPEIFGGQNMGKVRTLYLWTEKGALLHAKSLNTDKAWEAYEFLVDTYFAVKEKLIPALKTNPDKSKALEIKEMNARVRMSNQFLKLAEVETSMSKDYKSILVAKAAEVLAGEELLPLPKSEQKMYTATEIAKKFGTTPQKVGRVSNDNNMKVDEYGEWYKDKSSHSSKEVDSFRYNDKAVELFRELL